MHTKINKQLAKALAYQARDELEEIHRNGEISQELMKKINIAMIQGIYNGLECIEKAKSGKAEDIERMELLFTYPDYWKDPKTRKEVK